MNLPNPNTVVMFRDFIINELKSNVDQENIFVGIQGDGVYPVGGIPFVVLQIVDTDDIGLTSEEFVLNKGEEIGYLNLSNVTIETIQVDYYGNNAYNNIKDLDRVLNSQCGNEMLSEYGLGCQNTGTISNLSGIENGDIAQHRYSMNVELLNLQETKINNIDTFDNVSIKIKGV